MDARCAPKGPLLQNDAIGMRTADRSKTKPMPVKEALRRQRAYAAYRRVWAEAVGRPYLGDEDPRPPPGELDAGPEDGPEE